MVNSTYYFAMCSRWDWDFWSYVGFVGQPNTLLQYTHLNSSKARLWCRGKFQNSEKSLTVVLHSSFLRICKQGCLFFVLEIMAIDLLNVWPPLVCLTQHCGRANVGVGVILSHVGCHDYHTMIYKTKITLVIHLVLIQYNLSQIWYAYLKRFLRHSLSYF